MEDACAVRGDVEVSLAGCLPALRRITVGAVRGIHGIDADDVVHDTIERALRHRAALTARSEREVLAWCVTTAYRRVHEIRRRHESRQVPTADITGASDASGATSPDPADLVAAAEAAAAVRAALALLPERDRRILEAACYRGLPQRDIAADLGVTVPALNMLMFRARNRLRRELRGWDGSR